MADPYDLANSKLVAHYSVPASDAWNLFWSDAGGYPGNALFEWYRTQGATGDDIPALMESYFTTYT